MKKMKFLVVALTALLSHAAVQAQTLKNFLADKKAPLTYLGIDFTQTRYLGESALNVTDFKEKTMPSMNDVVVNEAKKFDIAGTFSHDSVRNDLSQVTKRNAAIDETKIKSDNHADVNRLTAADIEKVAANYSGKGVGVLFIMESLDKTAKQGAVYVVLVNLDTKKVLLSQRYTHDGKGFGVRNYWLHVIYETLEDISSHDYKKWKNANS